MKKCKVWSWNECKPSNKVSDTFEKDIYLKLICNMVAFISMAATLSNTIPVCAELYDRMMLYQETLKPDKDVEFIVEQYRTGRFCPRPILYNNFYYGSAMGMLDTKQMGLFTCSS